MISLKCNGSMEKEHPFRIHDEEKYISVKNE